MRPAMPQTIATKIIAAIGEPIETRAGSCTIGVSIGVAMCDGKDADCKRSAQARRHGPLRGEGRGAGPVHLD